MEKRNRMWPAINIITFVVLALILQTGGAYLVNAAIAIMGEGAAPAAQYSDYMSRIRELELRQMIHAVFVGPLLEELVFRLIFLRTAKKFLPFWAANLIQAVLFSVYHTYTIQRVYVFFLALMIGCVFYYIPIIIKKSLGPDSNSGIAELPCSLIGVALTFILHMIINASGVYLTKYLPADLSVSIQVSIGFAAAAIAGATAYVLYRQHLSENGHFDMFKQRIGNVDAGRLQ